MLTIFTSFCIFVVFLIITIKKHSDFFKASALLACGFTIILIFGVCIAQLRGRTELNQYLVRRQELEYRVEQVKNLPYNSKVYEDIAEFNQEIEQIRHKANNPWTSWFYYKPIEDIRID